MRVYSPSVRLRLVTVVLFAECQHQPVNMLTRTMLSCLTGLMLMELAHMNLKISGMNQTLATDSPPRVLVLVVSYLCCESFFIHYSEAKLNQW